MERSYDKCECGCARFNHYFDTNKCKSCECREFRAEKRILSKGWRGI